MVSLFARKMVRDFGRNRAQFIAVVVTILLGVMLFGASYDAYLNLKASYAALYDRTHFADLTVTADQAGMIAADGAKVPGVSAETTRYQADIPFRVAGTHKLLGRIVSLPQGPAAVDAVMLLKGTGLSANQPNGVLLEQHAASHFHLSPGDSLELMSPAGWVTVKIAGIAASPEYVWPARSRQDVLTPPDQFAVAFVPESLARQLTGMTAPNQALFTFSNASAKSQVVAIAQSHGATGVIDQSQQPSNEALNTDVSGFGEVALMFPILFLTAAAVAAYILLTRLIASQRAVIGMLAANGYRPRALLAHFGAYGVALGLAGAIPGAIAGLLLAKAITGLYTGAIKVPVTVSPLHPATAGVGILFGVIVGIIATAGPALLAARTPPAESMRGFAPVLGGGISAMEKLAPPLRRLPVRWKLVLRSIERNPRRSLYTSGGVVLALTLILVSWGMLDTTNILLDQQFHVVQRQNAEVIFANGAGPTTLSSLRSVPGVSRVEAFGSYPVAIVADGGTYQTALRIFQPDTQMHTFQSGGHAIALPDSGILVGRGIQKTLPVTEGSAVRVAFADGSTRQTRIAGFVNEPLGTYAYASTNAAAGFAPGLLANEALVAYAPGVNDSQVLKALTNLPEVAAVLDSNALLQMVQSFMGLFYAIVAVMLAFGGLMAFALMFNTMSVNISERQTELAYLSANGVSRAGLLRMVGYENVILTVLGIAPGLVVGYFVSKLFMASYSSDLFRFDLHMAAMTPVYSALLVLAVGVLAQLPALRLITRLDIGRVIRDRSW